MLGRDCFTFMALSRWLVVPASCHETSMTRFAILWVLIATLLTGCGQVIVFGHVVGDHRAPEPKTEPAPAETRDPQSSASSSASGPASAAPAPAETPLPAKSPSIASVAHTVKAVNVT